MNGMPLWYLQGRSVLALLQALAGMLIFTYPLPKRNRFSLRLLLGFVVWSIPLYLFSTYLYIRGSTPLALLSHACSAFLVYVSLIVICFSCYGVSIWTALFHAASGYMAQDIAGGIKSLTLLAKPITQWSRTGAGTILLDIICYGMVYVILYLVLNRFITSHREEFDNKLKAVFSVAVLIICIGMARMTQDNPERNLQAQLAENFMRLLIDGLVLALQFGVMEQARLSTHMETMRELVHQQRMQYEASKESAQIINEKYHDLKHLIKSFRGAVPQEQLDRLKQSIDAYERPANSGNDVLDVLLAEKLGVCQQRNIVLTCSLGQTDFSFVEELDLYALFQNALSNAIDAVSALPETQERFITLSAARDGNMLTIHMENPCQEDIAFVNGIPQTNKDPDWHGFGMKSMVRIAEKYGGLLTVEQQGNLFLLDILLLAPGKTG